MGNTQYIIQYYDRNGSLSYYPAWANSESQAITEFNNWIREQKRYSASGAVASSSRWGEIYKVEIH